MKFLISYECRNGENQFLGQFEFEATQEPEMTDRAVIEAALQHSTMMHKSGMAGLSIKLISPTSQ